MGITQPPALALIAVTQANWNEYKRQRWAEELWRGQHRRRLERIRWVRLEGAAGQLCARAVCTPNCSWQAWRATTSCGMDPAQLELHVATRLTYRRLSGWQDASAARPSLRKILHALV